jgi:hypothetical protein
MVFTTSSRHPYLMMWFEQATRLGMVNGCGKSDILAGCAMLSGAPLVWCGRAEGWWEREKVGVTRGK